MISLATLATRIHGASRQRGIAAVEFAIVVPVLLLLMLATAELGRAFYEYNTLTKTVRDGARYLAAHARSGSTNVILIGRIGPDGIPVDQAAKNITVFGTATTDGTPVLPGFGTTTVTAATQDSEHVRVSADYTYSPIFSIIPTFGLGADISTAFTFHASVVMRAL